MRFKLVMALAVTLSTLGVTGAMAQTQGDWLLGNYKGAGY